MGGYGWALANNTARIGALASPTLSGIRQLRTVRAIQLARTS
jgi:hypothetical protein